jgi:hypothetical protein
MSSPAMLPTVELGADAPLPEATRTQRLSDAVSALRVKGCVRICGAFSTELIDALRASFFEDYDRYFRAAEFDDALTVGALRYKVSVALQGPFNNPNLYANGHILPILSALLGDGFNLASLVSVIALPGAPGQGLHRDHPWLFGQVIDRMIPSYAIKLIIPLVDIDQRTGTTLIKPGSHVLFDEQALSLPSVEPSLRRGDCLLMDYRLLHEGTANASERIRPLLFLGYTRPWFKDHENFKKQTRLILATDGPDGIDPRYRFLFAEPLS